MTTLRFVGDLPLWLGLLLAAVVAIMAWRYYRRESFELPHRLRWFLPLLRSLGRSLSDCRGRSERDCFEPLLLSTL